jgi:UDP-N-acetylglucosamine 2-epimerase (non-hydrolysing)
MGELFIVAGARPNFMKAAPVFHVLRDDGRLQPRLVHTGQHYDAALSEQIMRDLDLPEPDHHLGVGPGSPSRQLARMLEALDGLLESSPPRGVVVVGDVTSTLAGALAAANREVPVAHVEAGLRSFDWTMPEERNRMVVDRLSRMLFVTEPAGVANLTAEGISEGVHLVGNVMIDSLLRILPRAKKGDPCARLGLGEKYAVLTLHRPGNVDDEKRFHRIMRAVAPLAHMAPLVFPVHPRTRRKLEALDLPPGFRCIEPLRYLDFIGLVARASLVLTDSGGLQEETTVLGVPCLTLRPSTERPITIERGTNELVDVDAERIQQLGGDALAGHWKEGSVPANWDGCAAERVVQLLVEELS